MPCQRRPAQGGDADACRRARNGGKRRGCGGRGDSCIPGSGSGRGRPAPRGGGEALRGGGRSGRGGPGKGGEAEAGPR
jgi:hypothetical protein